MSLSDPLTLLRDYTIGGKPVVLEGDHIVFGSTRFERTALTAYKAGATGGGDYYPIDSLWAILQKDPTQGKNTAGEYVAFCGSQNIKPVGITDRKKLVEFLTGKVAESKSVDYAGYEQPEPVELEDASAGLGLESAEAKRASKPKERAEPTPEDREKIEKAKVAFQRFLLQPIGVKPTAEELASAEGDEDEVEAEGAAAADVGADEGVDAGEPAEAAKGGAGADAMKVDEANAKAEEAAGGDKEGKEEVGGATKATEDEKGTPAATPGSAAKPGLMKQEILEAALLKQVFNEAKPFIRFDRERVQSIQRREIAVRDRTSVLLAPSTTKFGVLETLLEQFKHKNKRKLEETGGREAQKHQRTSGRDGASSGTASAGGVARPAPSGAFSAAGSAARPPTAGRTATSAPLQGAPRPVGSSAPPQPSATKHQARPPSQSTVSPAAARPSAFPGLRPGVTILIVPSAITSIVSMYNVRPLLEASEFTPGAELKAKEGFVKEASFLVSHTFEDGTKLELLVIDNPAKLQPHEWAQVGACIAQGSTWQFKGWPFPQGEVEIFAKMCGFYIRHSDEIPNQKTKGWTVTNLVFSREKSRRHEVGVIMTTFWVTLQKFLKIHKGNLLHNARSSRV